MPPFCHENYGREKHVNSISTELESLWHFFQGPPYFLQGSKILSQSPPPNKCLWTVPKSTRQNEQPKYFPNQNHSAVGFSIISLKKDVYLCLSCVFVYIVLRSAVSCFIFIFCVLLWNFIRRILSSWRMFLSRIIVYIFGNQVGIFVHIVWETVAQKKKCPVGFQWLKQHTYLDTLSRSQRTRKVLMEVYQGWQMAAILIFKMAAIW